MELFEKDAAFRSFHLDGQTIVADDYLEIKPQNRERLKKHVREGRFSAGPWYILQDEFLTSGESNVRNLRWEGRRRWNTEASAPWVISPMPSAMRDRCPSF